jgi:two-component system sensor kinase FixL
MQRNSSHSVAPGAVRVPAPGVPVGGSVLGHFHPFKAERWPNWNELRAWLGFELGFYLAYLTGMGFSQVGAAPLWFPDSVLLCALLLTRPRRWWWYVLGTLPVRLLAAPASVPHWFLLATFAIDVAKNVLLASALRQALGVPTRFATVRSFAAYCLLAVIAIPALAAVAGAAARMGLGYAFWPTWQQWFIGNALTYLLVTPALYFLLTSIRWPLRIPDFKLKEFVVLGGCLLLSAYLALGAGADGLFPQRLVYAPVPILLWAAIRFGKVGASFAVITLLTVFVVAAMRGAGPFAALFSDLTALDLQQFLLLTAAPYYFVAIVVDQEVSIEQSLRESESRFRTLAETAPAMIWMSGPDLQRDYFNQQWRAYTGAGANHDWTSLVHPDDRETVARAYRRTNGAHPAVTVEYRLMGHDGQYHSVLDQGVARLASDGTCLGYMGLCLDLEDRKRVELHRIELAHAGRVATMGQLASALAHELNQPLGAILRNAEAAEMILEQEPLDRNEIRAILSDIRQDDQRAGDVIDRMRAMLTRSDVSFEGISLKQLCDQIAGLLRQEMLSRRVTLQYDIPAAIPLVRGDRVQLQQVLINLVVNASDALNGAQGEDRRLDIMASRTDEHTVTLSVRDRGHGIPETDLPRLFEPFFTTKPSGMGVGLPISKAIVEAHGGRIWAENNQDGGATLSFTLKVGT